jgi:hypothetical protein
MDEQVIMMDCLTRLSDYKYITILDIDEYIIPNVDNFKDAWIHLLVSIISLLSVAKLVLWAQASSPIEKLWSCKCFPHKSKMLTLIYLISLHH